jgi:hypothetical protein
MLCLFGTQSSPFHEAAIGPSFQRAVSSEVFQHPWVNVRAASRRLSLSLSCTGGGAHRPPSNSAAIPSSDDDHFAHSSAPRPAEQQAYRGCQTGPTVWMGNMSQDGSGECRWHSTPWLGLPARYRRRRSTQRTKRKSTNEAVPSMAPTSSGGLTGLKLTSTFHGRAEGMAGQDGFIVTTITSSAAVPCPCCSIPNSAQKDKYDPFCVLALGR